MCRFVVHMAWLLNTYTRFSYVVLLVYLQRKIVQVLNNLVKYKNSLMHPDHIHILHDWDACKAKCVCSNFDLEVSYAFLWNSTIYWPTIFDLICILVLLLSGCLEFCKLCLQLLHHLFTNHAKRSINIHIVNFFLFSQSCLYHLLTEKKRAGKEQEGKQRESNEKVKLAISQMFKSRKNFSSVPKWATKMT